MKIAIIGCGYVGKAIAQKWYSQGHQLTLTTTSSSKIVELEDFAARVEVFKTSDLSRLIQICQGQDTIVVTVGSKGRTEENYRLAYLKTAQNLQKALADNQTVKQVIYTGSYSIVGNHDGAWVDETTPDKPPHIFAEILLATEKELMKMATEQLQVCILRLGGIYGENREIIKIFRNAMGQTRAGDGSEYGNWSHLEDIVEGIEFARENKLNGLYNLVSDEPMQRKVMLDKLAQIYNLPPVIWDDSQPSTRVFDVRVSNQKIKSLGFRFKYPQVKLV